MIFVKKGETLVIDHVSRNSSLVPTAADSTPTVTIYAAGDLVAKSNPITGVTVTAVTGETGAYVGTKDTSAMALGEYRALWSYTVSAAARRTLDRVVVA